MSWWRSLRDFGLQAIKDLDAIGERVAESLQEHVAPVVEDAATRLDRALDGSGGRVMEGLRRAYGDADERYQRFMVKRVDPLFGQTRTAQLEEMGSLEISEQEKVINRQIAFSGGLFVATVIGRAVFPASLLLTVPLAFTMVFPVFKMARDAVKKQRRITYHVVSSINVIAIYAGGLYVPALIATTVYYLGEKILMVTEDRSHKGLISVFAKQPRAVWIVRDGVEVQRPFEEVLPGDVVAVHAGSVMPVDGTILEGMATVDQQMLTGEAQPAEKAAGDLVYASTVVLSGKLLVRVDKAGSETVAAKIGEVLNRTASYQLSLQSRGSKIAHDAALPTLALSGLALATVGPSGALGMLNSAFGVSVRMSAPITMLNLFNIASSNAILLKDGRSLELIGEVDTVLFDKTGTLTLPQPNVARMHLVGRFGEAEVLALAAAAEHRQTHPIALAILAEAAARGIDVPEIDDARYEIGYGIKVRAGDRTVRVGSERYLRMEGIEISPEIAAERAMCHERGHSLVMVGIDGHLAGAIELQPTIRPEAEAVIGALRKRGLKMMIISGDQEEPTRRLAERLSLDGHFAGVLPEGKAALVDKLQTEGRRVCFVGDGINDSIALKKANISVSLRGATTAATDSAQVVLMQESLQKLPYLFELGDEMERSLRWGYSAGVLPGVATTVGVFLLGWGYYQALALSIASLAAGVGVAMYPVYKHRRELARVDVVAERQVEALERLVSGEPPLLPPVASSLPQAATTVPFTDVVAVTPEEPILA
jgi:heavy metal translocating P-type ATPase